MTREELLQLGRSRGLRRACLGLCHVDHWEDCPGCLGFGVLWVSGDPGRTWPLTAGQAARGLESHPCGTCGCGHRGLGGGGA